MASPIATMIFLEQDSKMAHLKFFPDDSPQSGYQLTMLHFQRFCLSRTFAI